MISKIWHAKLLDILLGFTFLIGLLPISNHMLSMQAMHMNAVASVSGTVQEKTSDNSTGSCCDVITPCSLGVAFLVPQTGIITSYGDSKRVISLAPKVQSIYIEALIPP